MGWYGDNLKGDTRMGARRRRKRLGWYGDLDNTAVRVSCTWNGYLDDAGHNRRVNAGGGGRSRRRGCGETEVVTGDQESGNASTRTTWIGAGGPRGQEDKLTRDSFMSGGWLRMREDGRERQRLDLTSERFIVGERSERRRSLWRHW